MSIFIDETRADLEKHMCTDLGRNTATKSFSDRLIDWVHYRARRIPQRPRSVTWSTNAIAAATTHPAIRQIAFALAAGQDVSPWLSTSIVTKKDQPKADLMFNDWQISHFHLGSVFSKPSRVARTKNLLFAFVAHDRAVLLDVKPHGAWTMLDLLRTLLQTSPDDMASAELNEAVGLGYYPTENEILNLRQSGITASFELDGRFFMSPGHGVATSCHSTRLVMFVGSMMRHIRDLRTLIEQDKLPGHLQREIFQMIGVPVRLGIRVGEGDLFFYDKNRSLVLTNTPLPE